jgi:hypothetical protein
MPQCHEGGTELVDVGRGQAERLGGGPVGEMCAGDEADLVPAGVLLREGGPQNHHAADPQGAAGAAPDQVVDVGGVTAACRAGWSLV